MSEDISKTIRRNKIIYWIFTLVIILLDVLPAANITSSLAKEGVRHLGFPDYFRLELSIAKIIGGLVLVLPMLPRRFKEWAYAGFGIVYISAFIAHTSVDGLTVQALPSVVALVVLVISYIFYSKVSSANH
jgi:hypothetical protein